MHTNLGLSSHKGQGSQEVGRCVEILVVGYCLRFCNFSIKLGTNVAAVYAHIWLASQKGQGSQEVVKCVKNTYRKKTWISLVQK